MHLSRIVAEWETIGKTWFWVWRGRPKTEEVRNFIVSSYQCLFRAGIYDTWEIESKSALLCLPGSCGGRLQGSDPVIWEVVIFYSPLVASTVRNPFLLSASLLSSYPVTGTCRPDELLMRIDIWRRQLKGGGEQCQTGRYASLAIFLGGWCYAT